MNRRTLHHCTRTHSTGKAEANARSRVSERTRAPGCSRLTHSLARAHLFLSARPAVGQQQLHGAHHLLPDGVQQGVARVDAVVQQELHDLQVLVLDGDEESAAAQRVQTVHVHVVVDLRLAEGVFDPCIVTWRQRGDRGAEGGYWLLIKELQFQTRLH